MPSVTVSLASAIATEIPPSSLGHGWRGTAVEVDRYNAACVMQPVQAMYMGTLLAPPP